MNAKNDFSYVITGYKEELRHNPKARLATYCRSLGVNDDRVHHWMEKHGLTVSGLKDEVLSSPQGIGNDFVPLSSEAPVPVNLLVEPPFLSAAPHFVRSSCSSSF